MADFRLTKRKQESSDQPNGRSDRVQPSPTQSKSLLSHAGGTAMSGLHTIGSILSTPSRVLWGTVNGLNGGHGGFGNMNPLDSTGGIELSHVLGNAGLIPKNDESKWELGDFGRGLIDIAGDPTSWVGIGGLTKAGVAASKAGTLTKGLVNSIRAGERGLLSFHHPLATVSHGAVGTGQAVGNAVHATGDATRVNQGLDLLSRSAPVTHLKKLFNASAMGRTTHGTQAMAEHAYDDITHGLNDASLELANTSRNMQARAGGEIASDAERHMIEMGIPSPEVRDLLGRVNQGHAEAMDLGVPIGDLHNTVKEYTKEGPKKALRTHILDTQGNIARTIDNTVGGVSQNAAPVNFLRPNDPVQYATRQIADGIEWGGRGGHGSRVAMAAHDAMDQKRNQELFGNASTDLINRVFQAAGDHLATLPAGLTRNERARAVGKFIKKEFRGEDLRSGTNLTGTYSTDAGALGQRTFSRPRELGNFIEANPQLAKTGPFTNHVGHDLHSRDVGQVIQNAKAKNAITFTAKSAAVNHGEDLATLRKQGLDNAPTVADAAKQLGLNSDKFIKHTFRQLSPTVRAEVIQNADREAFRLAQHASLQGDFRPIADIAKELLPNIRNKQVLNLHLPAKEYKSLTGFLDRAPQQEDGFLKSLNTVWKANMLAHPATQVRNAGSALVTNALQGAAGPVTMKHGVDLVRGQQLSGYDKIPEIAKLMASQNIDQTEAIRRLASVHFPVNQSVVGDLPEGQIGSTLKDLVGNVPGTVETPLHEAITGPAKALAGYRDGSHVGWDAANPAAIGGAFGHKETSFGPAMAANMSARNIEQPVRLGSWLGLLKQGYSAEAAAKKVGGAQVNYGPREFSEFEKQLKSVVPFYAFSSRAAKHVATELSSHPGGRMAQAIKSQDRAHAADPSIRDSILSGTALPLGTSADGTKRFITGLGLAHEPAVHTLGALAHGDFRGAGYDLLGMLNPLYKTPLEHITGQSFYQRGEEARALDPNVGRTLSNIGVMAGLRDPEAGPVTYPGSTAVETLLGASPLSRVASTVRSLTDTRKGLGEKLLNQGSGVKITDVSPKSQAWTLRKRAEDLAKAEGAHSRSEVYFSKKELEQLDKSNPKLAERQRELQSLLNALKSKSSGSGGSRRAYTIREPKRLRER